MPWERRPWPAAHGIGNVRLTRSWERNAPELDLMQQTVQYNVEISCSPCPQGSEAQIARRLQTAFPVTNCQPTRSGLSIRLASAHPFADGALKDFADLVADTLTELGIGMTAGVVRLVTRQATDQSGLWRRMQETAATLTGFDLRAAREVPVLYFYKGLRFDLDLTARMQQLRQQQLRVQAAVRPHVPRWRQLQRLLRHPREFARQHLGVDRVGHPQRRVAGQQPEVARVPDVAVREGVPV